MRLQRVVMVLLAGLWLPATAWAEGPPVPVDKGQFYIGLHESATGFETPQFNYLKLFVDDSAARGDGFITLENPQGNLINFDTDSMDSVPELTFGYGLADSAFGRLFQGTVRVEASAYYYSRSVEDSEDEARPDGRSDDRLITVTNGLGQEVERRTDLAAFYETVDGAPIEDANGWDGFLADSNFGIKDIEFDLNEDAAGGDLLFFFDKVRNKWRYSWGVGVTYMYVDQSFDLDFKLRRREWGFPGALASAGGDLSFDYDFDIETHFAGPKFAFSVGRELWRDSLIYVSGSFATTYSRAEMDSRQEAICLTTCEFGPTSDISRGVRTRNEVDETISYFVRGAAGMSIKLWRFVLSAELGLQETNGYFLPVQSGSGSGTEVRSEHAWGYYGRAGITLLL